MAYGRHEGIARFWSVFGVTAVATAIFWVIVAPFWYGTWRDTDSLINRAQVAAEADDMNGYLQELKGNLEERGMTTGHTRVIFKGPDNDLALNYQAVSRLIERLDGVQNLDKSSTTYQVALDDIRGTLRELPNPAEGHVWVTIYPWFLIVTVLWLATVIAWFFSDYADYI